MAMANRVTLIKTFFERADNISPAGGRKVEIGELKGLTGQDREELALMAAKELGINPETGLPY